MVREQGMDIWEKIRQAEVHQEENGQGGKILDTLEVQQEASVAGVLQVRGEY